MQHTVIKVSIIPSEDSWIDVDEPILPRTGPLIDEGDRIAARALIVAWLAGPAVGQRYSFGSCATDMASCRDLLNDPRVWRAANLARRLGSGSSNLALLWRETAVMANEYESCRAVEIVAAQLMHVGELFGEEVEKLIANLGQPRPDANSNEQRSIAGSALVNPLCK